MGKKKKKAKKKPTINRRQLLADALTDLIIGFILLLIEWLINKK